MSKKVILQLKKEYKYKKVLEHNKHWHKTMIFLEKSYG